ncbi:MAG: translation initiation factor IF-2 [Anaerolineae bacterium SM23_ 63]|nr:MAG: translation initiation factor IF-2 [Anaerolineae bacterium SM23_ 63]HEY46597.1 translation initiation factor IF-2 [Anaerolineae bacterium]
MSENGQTIIDIPESLTVRELAARIEVSPIEVIKSLMASGVMANINQQIDFDTAAIVMEEFGFEAKPILPPEIEEGDEEAAIPYWRRLIEDEDPQALMSRPPVVTMLGHVDHGKTTLLDVIRESNVAEGEAGGITQHIAAYQIVHNGQRITFLDTPGHEAFTAMRARGAQGADIAVLVVAADDGVMPQTREALAHARAARVPILVALNKMDRTSANPDRVKQELADVGLMPDDWDGETMVVPVSAKMREGIQDLLEAIVLVSDATEIMANPTGQVLGTVIDAELDRSKGVVATLLVQNGTLRVGDVVILGTTYGRVRAMFDFQGNAIEEASPSTPVSVLGLSEVPMAGELFTITDSERQARAIIEERKSRQLEERVGRKILSLDQVFEAYQAGKTKELRLVIKADVQGSLEPITTSLQELSAGDIQVNVLHSATGNISENDVMLATASDGIVIGFNVVADQAARRAADAEGVDIRLYDIIYRLTEDIEKALKGMLEPETKIVELGRAEVRATFRIRKVGIVAGCLVLEGELRRNSKVRVVRRGEIIFEGPMASLKHEQEDVREIREGFECGVGLKGFDSFEEGDILECYTEETLAVE